MNRRFPFSAEPTARVLLTSAALALSTAIAFAQQETRPELERIDRESRSLYAELRQSVVQVQLPPPKWVNDVVARENPLEKWKGQLDADVEKKLQEHLDRARQGEYRPVGAVVAATQPTTSESAAPAPTSQPEVQGLVATHAATPAAGGSVTLLAPVRVGQQVQWQPVTLTFASHIGLVLDDQGHLLVPLYVEREVVGDRQLPVTLPDGRTVGAKFVGSDRMMNLTVLQTTQPVGRPARVAEQRPADGALTMVVSPNSPGARLVVWTGGHQEMGLVAAMDGRCWGFARFGHFLELDDCIPVVDQLIKTGEVHRAQLGVIVQEVRTARPANTPALMILDVIKGSPADRAGLKKDDLILSLADRPVADVTTFAVAISQSSGPTTLQILHAGQPATVTVDLKPQ